MATATEKTSKQRFISTAAAYSSTHNNLGWTVFTEPGFLFFFLPFFLGVYAFAPRRAKNVILLIFSMVFYAWGEGIFIAAMLASILLNYFAGSCVAPGRFPFYRRWILATALVGNLFVLVVFKYLNLFVDSINALVSPGSQIVLEPIHLPIGISFFTFQGMSYIIDVYRGGVAPERNPLRVAIYIALFPQLIAGPIVRYQAIASELVHRVVTRSSFARGVNRFIIGFGKKVIVANGAAWTADQIFALPADELSVSVAWLGAVCYTLQLYFDFSGYSDMAVGLGAMLGFRFPENFRYPYMASSVTDFWRRWHISLSTWFRDYLYIPLGGNRYGTARTYLNLLIVFALCGLWHGAGWTFLIWGLFHGVFLVIEKMFFLQVLAWVPRLFRSIRVSCGFARILHKGEPLCTKPIFTSRSSD